MAAWKLRAASAAAVCGFGIVGYKSYISPQEVDIAILGGGMGGLALCAALKRNGFDAHVFEAAPELRTDTGTIISLGQHAMVALKTVHPELPSRIKMVGCTKNASILTKRDPGCDPNKYEERPIPVYTTVRWSEMQRLLAELTPISSIHCNSKVRKVIDNAGDGQRAEVVFENQGVWGSFPFLPRPPVRAKLVVGADGIRSKVRESIVPGHSTRYCGNLNWNAVVRNDPSAEIQYTDSSGNRAPVIRRGYTVVAVDSATGMLSYLADAGGYYSFWQLRINDATGACPHGNGHGGSGAKYPGIKQHVLSLLGESEQWADLRAIVEQTPDAAIYERRILDLPPLPTWSSPSGCVVLLGDAAHAMHPGAGMGARSAFEDADTLARCLVAACPPSSGGAAALHAGAIREAVARYERLRRPRVGKVQAYSYEHAGVNAAMRAKMDAAWMARGVEFRAWINQYPRNVAGDPAGQAFRPADSEIPSAADAAVYDIAMP